MRGRLKTAIVGPGHWGRNVARELNAVSDLVAYSGTDPAKNAEWARQHIPQARYLTIDEIAPNAEIAAVAVATPVPLLAPVARRLIDAGKHVLAEKPMAQSSTEASRLADAAAARGLTLAAGYVFVYHPVYREMKRRIGVQAVRRMTLRWEKFGTFTDAIEQSLLLPPSRPRARLAGRAKGRGYPARPGRRERLRPHRGAACLSACRGFLVHRPRGGAPGACGDGRVRRRHAPGMGWLQAVRRQGRRADRDRTFRYAARRSPARSRNSSRRQAVRVRS